MTINHWFTRSHLRSSVRSWWLCRGEPGAAGAGVLLGVIREAGEFDSGASFVTAAPENAGPSSECSAWREKAGISYTLLTAKYDNLFSFRPSTFK